MTCVCSVGPPPSPGPEKKKKVPDLVLQRADLLRGPGVHGGVAVLAAVAMASDDLYRHLAPGRLAL